MTEHDQLLSEDEHRAIEMAGELGALLRQIIGDGPTAAADWNEFAAPIHVIQRDVMKQAAARAYPDRYRLLGQNPFGGATT